MQIEDSYEGAVRRMARLSTNAGIDLLPTHRESARRAERAEPLSRASGERLAGEDEEAALRQRMRELEELATLATDENERLERELANARETIQRLKEQLTAQDRLRLREILETAPAERPRRRSWLPALAALAAAGVVAASLMVVRPWQYAPYVQTSVHDFLKRNVIHPWAVPNDQIEAAAAAYRAAHPPAPPKVIAPAPAVVPAAPAVTVAAVEPEHHAAKKHARHHHHAQAEKHAKPHHVALRPATKDSSDPLDGLGL